MSGRDNARIEDSGDYIIKTDHLPDKIINGPETFVPAEEKADMLMEFLDTEKGQKILSDIVNDNIRNFFLIRNMMPIQELPDEYLNTKKDN